MGEGGPKVVTLEEEEEVELCERRLGGGRLIDARPVVLEEVVRYCNFGSEAVEVARTRIV